LAERGVLGGSVQYQLGDAMRPVFAVFFRHEAKTCPSLQSSALLSFDKTPPHMAM
jgi:hypothetical protein